MDAKSSSLLILLLVQYFSQTWSQPTNPHCTPSACGDIRNISYPFGVKGDPKKCSDPRFELACENNVTILYLKPHKYYVKAINYSNDGYFHNSKIRLVDASISNDDICSFPNYSAYAYNFTFSNPERYPYPYQLPRNSSRPIHFMRCPNPLKNSSLFTEITHDCASNSQGYAYIKVGRMRASDFTETCELERVLMTSWSEFKDLSNVSLSEIHQSLLYGFELNSCPSCGKVAAPTIWERFKVFFFYSIVPTVLIIIGLLLAMICPPVMTIIGFIAVALFLFYHGPPVLHLSVEFTTDAFSLHALISTIIICAPRIIVFPLAMWLLIYKFRRKHLSVFDAIESFLQSDNKLTTIRYSYSDLKKMTRGFQIKLGEGGYGSVYKGKLRSGHHVAIKLLGKSGGNGQDFMNEIATIGRIHHVNVVKLVGYCAQGTKRALVYDFMPNGSLEKYLFNPEKMNVLNWDRKFEIAVGVARGIEYLHRGCEIQILHFDIKPHNILLDDNFIPKISDFGLAKFCSTEKNTMTLTVARGTIGYVAPELISRSIGAVSYKADVYSFGMMLMEMVGLKRDLTGNHADSSLCFPYWIYDYLKEGKDIEIEKANEMDNNDEDDSMRRKLARKMAIVALWCIQMSPDNRPSMNKVLKMLEGDVERLQIPICPTQIVEKVDESGNTCSSDSVSLLFHDDASPCVEITVHD